MKRSMWVAFFVLLCGVCLSAAAMGEPARAVSPGIGVVGDSNTEPYQCVGRGGTYKAVTFNWAEIFENVRGVNFGPGSCQDYNKSRSGATSNDIDAMTDGLLADHNNNRLSHVIFYIGWNDFNPKLDRYRNIYDGTWSDARVLEYVQDILTRFDDGLHKLISAGFPAGQILIIDIADPGSYEWAIVTYPDADGRARVSAAIADVNAGLVDLANTYGANFLSTTAVNSYIAGKLVNEAGDVDVGGEIIVNDAGDEPHNLRLLDGHPGTVASGLFANALIVDFLGITPLTDQELLQVAHIVSATTPTYTPTSPPLPTATQTPTTMPTATATHTPTVTNTPTAAPTQLPTATNTPTATATQTPTATYTPTTAATHTPTATATHTPTATATQTPTVTNTPMATATYSPIATATHTPTVTNTPAATLTSIPTATAVATKTPAATLIPRATEMPLATATSSPTATSTPRATATQTPAATYTPTATLMPTTSTIHVIFLPIVLAPETDDKDIIQQPTQCQEIASVDECLSVDAIQD